MTLMDAILIGLAIVGGLLILIILSSNYFKNIGTKAKGGFVAAIVTDLCFVFLRVLTGLYLELPDGMMLWAALWGAMMGMIWGAIVGIIFGLIVVSKIDFVKEFNQTSILSKLFVIGFCTFYWTIGLSALTATIALWKEVSRQTLPSYTLEIFGFVWLVIAPFIGAKIYQRLHHLPNSTIQRTP